MVPDPALMKAVEKLDYRVTTGDVASQSGVDIKQAERGLLALASDAGGHLQVSDTGDVVYLFPKNFRTILRDKSLRLRLQELRQRIWSALFYLIRISFGIFLIVSLVIIVVAITALTIIYSSQQQQGSSKRRSQVIIFPFWIRGAMFDLFRTDYHRRRAALWRPRQTPSAGQSSNGGTGESNMNFLEAVFSFLFGDGNPNADLSDRRWQHIATVIRNNGGAIAAEQIAPYLDLDETHQDDDDYILPTLIRFNGRPEVSPQGSIIYHFPELQVMAEKYGPQQVSKSLKEREWSFSMASKNQLKWAAGLGAANFIGAIVLGAMLVKAGLGGIIGLAYGVLLLYAIAFIAVPAFRFIWLKGKNQTIDERNQARLRRASQLDAPSEIVEAKIAYAQKFVSETVVSANDLAYTTETDLLEQETLNTDKIDEEWRQRLERLL